MTRASLREYGLGRVAGGLGTAQHRVTAALHEVRHRLPMPLRGIDSDNGSEFINQALYGYWTREGTAFTRSRAWKKNDSAHVEQKNGAIVLSAMIASPPNVRMSSWPASTRWHACP